MGEVVQRPLSYAERLESRDPAGITRIVIHATELPDLETAREYGERIHYPETQTGNSGHFYIDRDGRVEQWVPLERIAHHVRGHNADTVGIELVHRGRWPDWHASGSQHWADSYPDAQIDALVALLHRLKARLPALESVVGHDRLDTRSIPASDDPSKRVRRKLDPGPTFPWPELLSRIELREADEPAQ
jgi:N-acetylmuramoyl-L-alanine amidase